MARRCGSCTLPDPPAASLGHGERGLCPARTAPAPALAAPVSQAASSLPPAVAPSVPAATTHTHNVHRFENFKAQTFFLESL